MSLENTQMFEARIQTRKDTSANWTQYNPVLLDGEEILVVTSSGEIRRKIGDGVKTYTQLPFTDENLRALISEQDINMKDGAGENSLVGNDTDNNQAISAYSTALGNGTVAGSKGFRIIESVDHGDGTGTYTLEGYNGEYRAGLDGDVYSVRINNVYDRQGTIEMNDGNKVTVNNFVADALVTGDLTGSDANTFRVPDKPTIGNVDIGVCASAFGSNTRALGRYSRTEGYGTKADGKYSHAEGNQTEAVFAAHSEGWETHALGQGSHAEGHDAWAVGQCSHAEGDHCHANGSRSHAENSNTVADGGHSHSEGHATHTKGTAAHAEGYETTAEADMSHTEGYGTRATGQGAHAEGEKTIASGKFSHAEGNTRPDGTQTEASGAGAHSEGTATKASGDASHSEGLLTEASGARSHAEGSGCKAQGFTAHAEGGNTEARADYSHSEGLGTIAASQFQHVQGKYNVEDTTNTYAHIVGGGTSDTNRKNIHTIDWNGNAMFGGSLTLGNTTITEDQLKKLLTLLDYTEYTGGTV